MKYYIQFYKESLNYDGKQKTFLMEATGDRGVVILDGRNNTDTMVNDGFNFLKLRQKQGFNYVAFTIQKGDFRSSINIYTYNPTSLNF